MITSTEMDAWWTASYSACPPIPYLLRDRYPRRWVRFHSLPGSKRYADREAESLIVLDRHNTVLDELADPSELLIFASTGYSDTVEPLRDNIDLQEQDTEAQHWRTIAKHELDGDEEFPNYWHLFMSGRTWTVGCLDSILRLVADNTVANTMIVSPQSHWIYHPYDGGADVILPTTERRNQLRRQFKDWLSRRSDGM